MDFTASNVEEALGCLYQPHPGDDIAEVNNWLIKAQQSPEAWKFIWLFLHRSKRTDVQFFGACSLLYKIHHLDLQEEEHTLVSLRAMVIDKLILLANESELVCNKLCSCVGSLILHLSGLHWEKPVCEIISAFTAENSNFSKTKGIQLLLDILAFLPVGSQELSKRTYNVKPFMSELAGSVEQVVGLLVTLLKTPSEFHLDLALSCCLKWVPFFKHLKDEKPVNSVIEAVFGVMFLKRGTALAADVICSMIEELHLNRLHSVSDVILKEMSKLSHVVHENLEMGNKIEIESLCHLFTVAVPDFKDQISWWMLEEEKEYEDAATAVLTIFMKVVFPPGIYPVDEKCSMNSLDVFEQLFDNFLNFDSAIAVLMIDVAKSLLRKLVYPENFESWNEDDVDQFTDFRANSIPLLMKFFDAPGFGFENILWTEMKELIPSGNAKWQEMETIFFSLVSAVNAGYTPKRPWFELAFSIYEHTQSKLRLLLTVLMLKADVFDGESEHKREFMNRAVREAIASLSTQDLCNYAIWVLDGLTADHFDYIYPYLSEIISQTENIFGRFCFDKACCHLKYRLMESVSWMSLISCFHGSHVLPDFIRLLGICSQHLKVVVLREPTEQVRKCFIYQVKLLSHCFCTLKPPKPGHATNYSGSASYYFNQDQKLQSYASFQGTFISLVFQVLVPFHLDLLEYVFNKWKNDDEVVQAVCRMFQNSVLTLKETFRPVADVTFIWIRQMFEKPYSHGVLDIIKDIAMLCKSDESLSIHLDQLLAEVFRGSQLITISDDCEALIKYFNLMENLITTSHERLTSSIGIPRLFHQALENCTEYDMHLFDACSSFLKTFLNAAPHYVEVEDLEAVVGTFLKFVHQGALPKVLTQMSDVLRSCCGHKSYCVMTMYLQKTVMDSPLFKHVNKQNKFTFVENLCRNTCSVLRHNEVIRFSHLCCHQEETVTSKETDSASCDIDADLAGCSI